MKMRISETAVRRATKSSFETASRLFFGVLTVIVLFKGFYYEPMSRRTENGVVLWRKILPRDLGLMFPI